MRNSPTSSIFGFFSFKLQHLELNGRRDVYVGGLAVVVGVRFVKGEESVGAVVLDRVLHVGGLDIF